MELYADLHLQNSTCQNLPSWHISSSRNEDGFEKLTMKSSSSRATAALGNGTTKTRSAMAKAISKFAVRKRGYSTGTSFTSLSMTTTGSSEFGYDNDHSYAAIHDDGGDLSCCRSDGGVVSGICDAQDIENDDDDIENDETYWVDEGHRDSTRCRGHLPPSPSSSPSCRRKQLVRRHSCDSSCSTFSPNTQENRAAQLEFLCRERTALGVRVVWIPLGANVESRVETGVETGEDSVAREQVSSSRPSRLSTSKKPPQQAKPKQRMWKQPPVRGLQRERKYRNLNEALES